MKYMFGLLFVCSLLNASGFDELAKNTVDIIHEDNTFKVVDEDGVHPVQNCFVDKELRNRTQEEILGYASNNNYFLASRMSDGEYAIHGRGRLLGGGAGGATGGCLIGQFIGNAVVFTGIAIASGAAGSAAFFVGGPAASAGAATVTFKSLTATVVPVAQPFIHSVAIAGGIAGGIATGPA